LSKNIYVIGAARTPVGSFQGSLSSLSAPELGANAIKASIEQAAIEKSEISEVIFGNVVSAGLKQAPARQAMRNSGIPDSCGATTINKVCGSGMKSIMLANDLIQAGSADTIIAGGMESMSNAPYLLPKARAGLRMGHQAVQDALFLDGLEDAETGGSMGSFAQNTADEFQLTRQEMDEYATQSVNKARNAISEKLFVSEIQPIQLGEEMISDDEQPGRAKLDKIASLRPAFKSDGTITAANSSSISDGASSLILTSNESLIKKEPLARIVGHHTHSIHPSQFTIAPVGAIEALLEKLDWQKDEVDLFEINEAFAMVTMLAIQELKLDADKVNIYGGACAQGHPIGSTGSRLVVTLAHAMQRLGKKKGIAALCIGGGEATAVALERT
jgi:acetyl-CoA C-acetyltransferase